MNKYKRLTIWLPVIIAASIALGIFIGNHFVQIGKHRGYSYVSGNKINTILDIINTLESGGEVTEKTVIMEEGYADCDTVTQEYIDENGI